MSVFRTQFIERNVKIVVGRRIMQKRISICSWFYWIMELLKLMMRKSDLLNTSNSNQYNSDRLPLIHLDQLPKILICKCGSDGLAIDNLLIVLKRMENYLFSINGKKSHSRRHKPHEWWITSFRLYNLIEKCSRMEWISYSYNNRQWKIGNKSWRQTTNDSVINRIAPAKVQIISWKRPQSGSFDFYPSNDSFGSLQIQMKLEPIWNSWENYSWEKSNGLMWLKYRIQWNVSSRRFISELKFITETSIETKNPVLMLSSPNALNLTKKLLRNRNE